MTVAKKKKKLLPFDSSTFLDSQETVEAYLVEALASNDPAFIAHAIGQVAKAKGMTKIARKTGLGRESLYKALSGEHKPEFATILLVLEALGYSLQIKPVSRNAA